MKTIFKKLISTMLIAAVMFSVSVGIPNVNTKEIFAATTTKVTYANFLKIKMGAKYSDVVKFMGKGKVYYKNGYTTTYFWGSIDDDKYIEVEVMVNSGKLFSKEECGLYNKTSNITLYKYNKIKNNMTISQVVAILGPGELYCENEVDDSEDEKNIYRDYCWLGHDKDNWIITIRCSFKNGKLYDKTKSF